MLRESAGGTQSQPPRCVGSSAPGVRLGAGPPRRGISRTLSMYIRESWEIKALAFFWLRVSVWAVCNALSFGAGLQVEPEILGWDVSMYVLRDVSPLGGSLLLKRRHQEFSGRPRRSLSQQMCMFFS